MFNWKSKPNTGYASLPAADYGTAHALGVKKDRELLRAVLIPTGYLSEDKLDAACETALSSGKRLADVLLQQKLVSDRAAQVVEASLHVAADWADKGVSLGGEEPQDGHDEPVSNLWFGKTQDGQSGPTQLPGSLAVVQAAIEPQQLEPSATKAGLGLVEPKDEIPDDKPGFAANFTFKAQADNAPEVKHEANLTVTPPMRTALAIEETVSPENIPDDEVSEVRWTVMIKNTRRAVANNVTLGLDDFPRWFKVSRVSVENMTLPSLDGEVRHLKIGDIAPGESISVTIVGFARPDADN